MSQEDWAEALRRARWRSCWAATPSPRRTSAGQRIVGDALLVLLNAHHEPVRFTVPPPAAGARWLIEFYTADDKRGPEEPVPSGPFELTGRSLAVFREVPAT